MSVVTCYRRVRAADYGRELLKTKRLATRFACCVSGCTVVLPMPPGYFWLCGDAAKATPRTEVGADVERAGMPRKCCVPGCKSNCDSSAGGRRVTVFSLPKDESRRRRWLRAIGGEGFEPGRRAVVCADHFSDRCVVRRDSCSSSLLAGQRRVPKLAADACPTLFPGRLHLASQSSRDDDDARGGGDEEDTCSDDSAGKPPPPPPPSHTLSLLTLGVTVAGRLPRSPPTKANRVQSPLGPHPDVGIVLDDATGRRVFSGISRFPLPGNLVLLPTLIDSQDLGVSRTFRRSVFSLCVRNAIFRALLELYSGRVSIDPESTLSRRRYYDVRENALWASQFVGESTKLYTRRRHKGPDQGFQRWQGSSPLAEWLPVTVVRAGSRATSQVSEQEEKTGRERAIPRDEAQAQEAAGREQAGWAGAGARTQASGGAANSTTRR
ncbi:hypothetical protein PR048_025879 [Dryococelus australis]|uniref:THAP-type domain-containing protein n=1 Tax=Dryococelus australis TaxID=614101 RepID=A0ABQ9GJU3_9NEOP|nr:hypothetical protein PR048_025879 [Dryococelus australis]